MADDLLSFGGADSTAETQPPASDTDMVGAARAPNEEAFVALQQSQPSPTVDLLGFGQPTEPSSPEPAPVPASDFDAFAAAPVNNTQSDAVMSTAQADTPVTETIDEDNTKEKETNGVMANGEGQTSTASSKTVDQSSSTLADSSPPTGLDKPVDGKADVVGTEESSGEQTMASSTSKNDVGPSGVSENKLATRDTNAGSSVEASAAGAGSPLTGNDETAVESTTQTPVTTPLALQETKDPVTTRSGMGTEEQHQHQHQQNGQNRQESPNEQPTETNDSLTADQLRTELEETRSELERVRAEQSQRMEDDASILMELQSKLQEHMSARAEAENKARISEKLVEDLQKQIQEQAATLEKYIEMEESWQTQRAEKAEIENDLYVAKQQIGKVEEEKGALSERLAALQKEVDDLRTDRDSQEEELRAIREQRDEQERREIALTNRLNAAKKMEAKKANLAEHFEDEMKALRDDAKSAKDQVEELTGAKALLEDELAHVKGTSQNRIRQAELALADEKRLNEDRKGKMKAFIEKKSEELRQAKADAESMQTELNQTSRSLMDLNNRWKQLHAQWVQSQTRNRELQRDLNRLRKDSENLHKVGDTLEMKLSRSTTETEEHKNKRLAAKNELMTVLRTLEAEREVSARLRDAIKFTFTPKTLSQQQLLRENLEEFENELMRLARHFGKPLPPVSGGGLDTSERSMSLQEGDDGEEGKASRTDMDIQRLIGKLDQETQGVSQYIMALSGEIEKLHMLIDVSANRTCYSTLSDMITGGSNRQPPETSGRESTSEASLPLRAIRSHAYGQVPSN